MHDYAMLAEGDSVLVAVSGGIDSLALTQVLAFWQKKAPIRYTMHCVHIDMEGNGAKIGSAADQTQRELRRVGFPLTILPARWKPNTDTITGSEAVQICFRCSRSRRKQLFDHAGEQGHNKLALGHHRDDIIETFFLNLTCAGNISTMRPSQELFEGNLHVIRPLAYCHKAEVEKIGRMFGFKGIPSSCPLSERTRRKDIQEIIEHIYKVLPHAGEQIFAAMGNVREDYLLLPKTRRSRKRRL